MIQAFDGFDYVVASVHSLFAMPEPEMTARVCKALSHPAVTMLGHATGRLLVVFGCGGDRDRAKRPRMGAAVSRGAHVAVLTTDNPRSEAPEAIAADVLPGLREAMREVGAAPGEGEFAVILDRAEAIAAAVSLARAGDVVLIAGKGHETYQEVRGVRAPFDDREVAARALELHACQRA